MVIVININLLYCTIVSLLSIVIFFFFMGFSSQEFFSKKSDCSLFLFGSHNKKRPNNLVFGKL